MNRDERAQTAKQTVSICETGSYITASGLRITIASELEFARAGTVLYTQEAPPSAAVSPCGTSTRIEVGNETTFQALERLAADEGHVACLSFASAKNPGGGFLNGSLAQEEALACASGLYPCLLAAPAYYERNRANRSPLYLDMAIFSPMVPFFRNDRGMLLEKPFTASVITAPAPNAGAVQMNEPDNLRHVEPTLRRRARLVLQIAAAHRVDKLVLGAWGCGVFRNDPASVARIFSELLLAPGEFADVFSEVAFAVFDRSSDGSTFRAFANRFAEGRISE